MCRVTVILYICCGNSVYAVRHQLCGPRYCDHAAEIFEFHGGECGICEFGRVRKETRKRARVLQAEEELEMEMAGMKMGEGVETKTEDENVEKMIGTLKISDGEDTEDGAEGGTYGV